MKHFPTYLTKFRPRKSRRGAPWGVPEVGRPMGLGAQGEIEAHKVPVTNDAGMKGESWEKPSLQSYVQLAKKNILPVEGAFALSPISCTRFLHENGAPLLPRSPNHAEH